MAFDLAHFVMEQKMLRGVRDRAQAAYRDEIAAYVRRKFGLYQRAEDAGGSFIIEAEPPSGTQLRWCAPLP